MTLEYDFNGRQDNKSEEFSYLVDPAMDVYFLVVRLVYLI